MHGNQVLVNAHILLANLGSDAFVFSVDLDEYLITEKRTTLPELVEGCLGNRTSRMARCAPWSRVALCVAGPHKPDTAGRLGLMDCGV